MLIGVSQELSDACKEKLNPIPVMRVGHLAAAAERIVLTRPLLAVIAEEGTGAAIVAQTQAFRELAAGVGCEVVMLAELGADHEVPANLEARAIAASRKRSGEFQAV